MKDAPDVGDDDHLSAEEERRLYEHYHIDPAGGRDAYVAEQRTQQGYDTERRFDQDYDVDEAAVTRDTQREATGTVRLRRYVITER